MRKSHRFVSFSVGDRVMAHPGPNDRIELRGGYTFDREGLPKGRVYRGHKGKVIRTGRPGDVVWVVWDGVKDDGSHDLAVPVNVSSLRRVKGDLS